MIDDALLISDGISRGASWGTYRRKGNGSLRRVVSPALPLRPTREEAERDLDAWRAARREARGSAHRIGVSCDAPSG